MTEAIVIALIVNVCATIGLIVKAVFDYKSKKPNGKKKPNNSNPVNPNGRSLLCLMHGEKLTKLETRLDSHFSEIQEIKADVRDVKNRQTSIIEKIKEIVK